MMIDRDVAAASPASVYRVLSAAGLLDRWNKKPSKKGTGFVQPLRPHEHWHIDIAYLNLSGTFYYLCSILDGASRAIVHWDIRESMTETDVECILQRAHEMHPDEKPRIISDNGPQFIAKDFKEYIRLTGMTHVRTAPYYPQSNGKLERYHKTIKSDAIRPGAPRTLDEARALVANSSSTTTRSACTARSATSPRPTSSPVAATRSGPRATASSKPRAKSAPIVVPSSGRQHDVPDWRCSGSPPGRTAARGGTRPPCDRRPSIHLALAALVPGCPASREERTAWRDAARPGLDARPPRGARADPRRLRSSHLPPAQSLACSPHSA
jgi:transposase-like protein